MFLWTVSGDQTQLDFYHRSTSWHDWLKDMCLEMLPIGLANKANVVFKTTLMQILYAKVYKEACLADNTYKYWKSWVKTQFHNLVHGNDLEKK